MGIQVLVVGAGPVGLAMASELARHGVAVRVVDKVLAPTDRSKALVLWSRTLELMRAMGCADALVAAGLKVRHANISAGRRRLAHIPLDQIRSPYPYALFLPQSETERLLAAHLTALGGRVERGVELVGAAQDENGVTAELAHADGKRETLRADWLVACDGAHSTVRHLLGIPFTGDTLESDWILADLYLDGAIALDEVSIFWHQDGVLAVFPILAGRVRVIADLGVAQGPARHTDPTLAEVQAVLAARGPGGLTARDPIWLSSFRINERKVRNYRHGRIFLAGDAAHIHSPAGGQGMNTGIQDACGLAWRLALVCRGRGRDGVLLDSYSQERSAVGERVLRNAGRLTRLALLRGRTVQAVRNTLFAIATRMPPVRRRFELTLSELDIAYPTSPLSQAAKGAPRDGAVGRPGERARDVVLVAAGGDRTTLYDLLRSGRFVLALPDGAGDDAAAQRIAARYGHSLVLAGGLAASGACTLVRPDGYVGVVAQGADWPAVETYLAALLKPE